MGALTFQPNGDRIDALQVDGEPVAFIYPNALGRAWVAYPPGAGIHAVAIHVGTLAGCQQAIVRAWAQRFPHA